MATPEPNTTIDNQIKHLSDIFNGSSFIEPVKKVLTINESEPYLISYYNSKSDFTDETIALEPILSENSAKFTVLPIEYHDVWKNYKTQCQCYWVCEEIDLSRDEEHWNSQLSNNDKVFISHVLAFFNSFDGIVNDNLRKNVIDVIKIKEAEGAYGRQFDMEFTHGEMYSLMLDTFVKDHDLKNKLINAVETMPAIKKKAEWCRKWIDSDKPFAHKIIAFAIVEGIFFSGSFASIFWLKTRPGSIMPGLRKSNKFISRDETLHVLLAITIYSLLNNKLKESVVYDIIDEAIQIESEFITESLPCRLLGMNSDLMTQYIMYCADRLLVQLGYNKKYNKENPFEFMNKIDIFCKSNFFEERNDNYSDSNINNDRNWQFIEGTF